jgi:archaellum component FlaC
MVVMTPRENWTDERLDDLAEGVGEVRAEVRDLRKEVAIVREGLGEIRAEVRALTKTIDARFEAVDERFKGVDARFDAVDKQFDAVDKRFDAMDKRFDDVMRTMQIGFGLIGAILAALLGMVATQL